MATNTMGTLLSQPQRSYTRQSGTASGLGQPQAQNRPTCPTGYRYDTVQAKCVPVNQTAQPSIRQQLGAPTVTPQPATSYASWGQQGQGGGQKKSTTEVLADVLNNAINHLGSSSPTNAYTPAPIGKQLTVNPDFIKMVTGR
jgi:hypothetical protein